MTTETPEGCVRCGDFGAFATRLFGRGVCKDCLETPEGGLLIRYRQDSWGRRDFYVSLAAVSGFFSLAYCIAATTTYLTKPRLEMIFVLIVSAILLSVSLAYLFLFPWARRATMILSLAIPAVIVIAMTIADGVFQPAVFGGFGIVGVIAFVIARSAYRDVRNKLAFKIDVETAELEALLRSQDQQSSGGVWGVLWPLQSGYSNPGAPWVAFFIDWTSLRRHLGLAAGGRPRDGDQWSCDLVDWSGLGRGYDRAVIRTLLCGWKTTDRLRLRRLPSPSPPWGGRHGRGL
jgi:hypothetical protein